MSSPDESEETNGLICAGEVIDSRFVELEE
jgi:hypothetical protein